MISLFVHSVPVFFFDVYTCWSLLALSWSISPFSPAEGTKIPIKKKKVTALQSMASEQAGNSAKCFIRAFLFSALCLPLLLERCKGLFPFHPFTCVPLSPQCHVSPDVGEENKWKGMLGDIPVLKYDKEKRVFFSSIRENNVLFGKHQLTWCHKRGGIRFVTEAVIPCWLPHSIDLRASYIMQESVLCTEEGWEETHGPPQGGFAVE